MKVYLASNGSYDDHRIVAAFADYDMAAKAGENEPLVLDVLEELPPQVHVRKMSWSARLMHQVGSGHFHAPNPDPIDCPYTNVLSQPTITDSTASLWPWDIDEGKTISSCEVQTGGSVGQRWVQVEGVDFAEVARQFELAVVNAKTLMIRKAES